MKIIALTLSCLLTSSAFAQSEPVGRNVRAVKADRFAFELAVAHRQIIELEREIERQKQFRQWVLFISVPTTLYNLLKIVKLHAAREKSIKEFQTAVMSRTPQKISKDPTANQIGFLAGAVGVSAGLVIPTWQIGLIEAELAQVRRRLAAAIAGLHELAVK